MRSPAERQGDCPRCAQPSNPHVTHRNVAPGRDRRHYTCERCGHEWALETRQVKPRGSLRGVVPLSSTDVGQRAQAGLDRLLGGSE